MDLFVNHRQDYERLYNCTGIDPTKYGTPNPFIGSVQFTVGTVLEIMYIPCMIVLVRKDFRQNSCYKLMFLLGFFDMVTIVINSLINGFLSFQGATFCTYPKFIYFCGVAIMNFWCGTCMTSVILGINRAVDLWFPNVTTFLFGGKRTYVWCLFPFIYGAFMGWKSKTFIFSTRGYAWYNSPYEDIEWLNTDPHRYNSTYHAFNNFAVMILTSIIYIILAASVWYKTRDINSQKITKLQKQLIYQSCAICTFIIVADAIYVYAQYYTAPPLLVILGHSCWIACHGSAVVIYFTCNETIQSGVFELLRIKKIRYVFSSRINQVTATENTEYGYRRTT
ncbi:hypothetical protein QR680_016214 [Steinernema hermaphroditum]|uniref:Uncharacterized protein n=1 Tax=Steinernema hermaphroditum TaxID=289476 RepID=A0AA39LLZ1_9BILA|nr:hypothetical protein QR680_016214 [Steinernema hermaphroditum]